MPYVHRTALGEIDSLHRQPLPGASEFLDNEHPDVQRFVGNRGAPENFGVLDAEFVRVLEDLIDTMIMKNLITITELPLSTRLWSTPSSLRMSSKCRPVVGSSST